jgi:hypothetical protein
MSEIKYKDLSLASMQLSLASGLRKLQPPPPPRKREASSSSVLGLVVSFQFFF